MEYCAFLRGVNVNGTVMRMTDVKQVFQENGAERCVAILATGNIVFSSAEEKETLKPKLTNAMGERFGYDAHLFIYTKEEIAEILKSCPFPEKENYHTYIFLGEQDYADILEEELNKAGKSEEEVGQKLGGVFYWQVEKGNTLASDFGKVLGKKNMKDRITSRNINTIRKVSRKFQN